MTEQNEIRKKTLPAEYKMYENARNKTYCIIRVLGRIMEQQESAEQACAKEHLDYNWFTSFVHQCIRSTNNSKDSPASAGGEMNCKQEV